MFVSRHWGQDVSVCTGADLAGREPAVGWWEDDGGGDDVEPEAVTYACMHARRPE